MQRQIPEESEGLRRCQCLQLAVITFAKHEPVRTSFSTRNEVMLEGKDSLVFMGYSVGPPVMGNWLSLV